MNEEDFQSLLKDIISKDLVTIQKSTESLYNIAKSGEIRDFEWPYSSYSSLWIAITYCWQSLTSTSKITSMTLQTISLLQTDELSDVLKIETMLWSILKMLFRFPDYDCNAAAEGTFLTKETVQLLLTRLITNKSSEVVSNTSGGSSSSGTTTVTTTATTISGISHNNSSNNSISSCSNTSILQEILYWIYLNRTDLRPSMRLYICTAIHKESAAIVPASGHIKHKDSGRSRSHVAPLLEVLACIIEGFSYPLLAVHTGRLCRQCY